MTIPLNICDCNFRISALHRRKVPGERLATHSDSRREFLAVLDMNDLTAPLFEVFQQLDGHPAAGIQQDQMTDPVAFRPQQPRHHPEHVSAQDPPAQDEFIEIGRGHAAQQRSFGRRRRDALDRAGADCAEVAGRANSRARPNVRVAVGATNAPGGRASRRARFVQFPPGSNRQTFPMESPLKEGVEQEPGNGESATGAGFPDGQNR
jgi:hypothetical protein